MPGIRFDRFVLLVTLVTAFLLAGCGPDSVEAPRPDVIADDERPPELPLSTLHVPILYDLHGLLPAIEGAVPARFGNLEERISHPTNDRVSFAFEVERSPLEAELKGEIAHLGATLWYRGRGWYDPPLLPEVSASCGTSDSEDDRPRAVVAISGPLTVDRDWTLIARTRLDRIGPATSGERDQCRVTVFGIDVTERVIDAAADLLRENTDRIDAEVATVDLRSRFDRIWGILSEPIELTDDVWLVLDPRGLSRGRTGGEGLLLRADVGLTASPRIVLGPRPEVERTPLPPLEPETVGDGLHILLAGEARYEEAGELLNRELAGMTLSWGGNTIRLRELTLSGIGGGRVALEVDFDGSAEGRVFLVGRPVLEPGGERVVVPDLDFDVATRSLLVSGLAWLARGELVEFLRERARLPVDEVMGLAEEQLHRGLNRRLSDDVTLEGRVFSSEVLGVLATRRSLVVHAHAQAEARIHVDQTGGEQQRADGGRALPSARGAGAER